MLIIQVLSGIPLIWSSGRLVTEKLTKRTKCGQADSEASAIYCQSQALSPSSIHANSRQCKSLLILRQHSCVEKCRCSKSNYRTLGKTTSYPMSTCTKGGSERSPNRGSRNVPHRTFARLSLKRVKIPQISQRYRIAYSIAKHAGGIKKE